MHFVVKTTAVYRCSLERAFKTPMLCDVSKVHTGFLLMPRVTHCTEDEDWGRVDQVRIDYTYTLHAGAPWLLPAQWLFARLFWPVYMTRVLENVRKMAEGDEPYRHA